VALLALLPTSMTVSAHPLFRDSGAHLRPVIAFCATVCLRSRLGVLGRPGRLGLQALVFLKDLYAASTAKPQPSCRSLRGHDLRTPITPGNAAWQPAWESWPSSGVAPCIRNQGAGGA